MKQPPAFLPSTRREFLKKSFQSLGLISFSAVAPQFLTQSTLAGAPLPEKDRSILVLIQLAGGNDGLNTLIPFQDDDYYRLRPNLSIRDTQILPIADNLAFHPRCRPLANLYDQGLLSIIQNVGYPNPNRSHFRSTEIWETASESEATLSTGWVGRYFDNACTGTPESDPAGVHIGNPAPQTFLGTAPHAIHGLDSRTGLNRSGPVENQGLLKTLSQASPLTESHAFLQHTAMNALITEERVQQVIQSYRSPANYPQIPFAQGLKNIAAMIAGGFSTRVYFSSHTGYDTHARQLNTHANLLQQFSESIASFQKDLQRLGLDQQVITLVFSEFGRRPAENASGGTDHGTAAPLFLLGPSLNPGLYGEAPRLQLSPAQDIPFHTDFRQVYATLLQNWFQTPSEPILGHSFPLHPCLDL